MATLTSILDHIVHLTPPRFLPEATRYFQSLGFIVVVGGVHAGGLTENSLIILPDSSYIELIAFTHSVEHYPEGTPDRSERESQPWAKRLPGWIDYANAGTSPTLSQIINARAKQDRVEGVHYLPERPGGRETPDGRVLKWIITALDQTGSSYSQGVVLPFFCGDVTPREWRVPEPAGESHPNRAVGIAYLRLLVLEEDLLDATRRITTVLGLSPLQHSVRDVVWALRAPKAAKYEPQLILSAPKDDGEREYVLKRGQGLYEVGFRVDSAEGGVFLSPDYGKVVLVPT